MPEALIQRVVHVTPEHIERGLSCNPMACPLALALWDVYRYASVGSNAAYVGNAEWESRYRLSPALQRWVEAFDAHDPVEPIDVAVDAEQHLLWVC